MCIAFDNLALDLTSLKNIVYILLLFVAFSHAANAQKGERQLVQFSGFALSSDSMKGIPFAHIGIKGTNRAGIARVDGFFSFAVAEGDTLIFTSIGYSPSFYLVPFNNEDNKVSVIINMNKNSYSLPTVTIYPWGNRADFPYAFVHTKIPKDLQEIAEENTNRQLLAALGESLPVDGGEATQRYLQYHAAQYYYYNQQAPQNIFNPLAWAEFIKALKNGDFKKKADAPLPSHDY
jgi:hypothetical protein